MGYTKREQRVVISAKQQKRYAELKKENKIMKKKETKKLDKVFQTNVDVQENNRPKTEEEIREEFLEHIRGLVEYWEQENRTPSVRGKLEGLAFSILSAIDGESADLPGYELRALPSSDEDIQLFREKNENYYGEAPFDIAGCLHEHFYKKQEEVKVKNN